MPNKVRLFFIALLASIVLSACASLAPGFEEPTIEVTSIRLVNFGNLTPEFDIALRVSNPNRDDLSIDALTYTLYLGGNEVVSGGSNDIPSLPGFGAAEVKLRARLSLFGGLNLLNDLMNEYQQSVDYELVTEFDVGRFYPMITSRQKGVFNF